MNRIKKSDTVIVTTGRSKGHIGKVLKVQGLKLLVEGANLIKKHVKPNPNLQQEGGIVVKESLIHSSNVAMYNETTGKAEKIGFKFIEENGLKKKVRYFKSSDQLVDIV